MLRDFSIQQAISFLFLVSLLVFSRLFVLITSRNSTEVTEFFLLGFGVQYEFQYFLFTVFLVIYGTSRVGIIGMILLIKIDSRLQTPMYFFLQHLAFVDICFTSVVTPKMMQNFIIENKSISFKGCVVQLLVYTTFVTGDCYLLAATAVDHYVAVCNPLHYPTIMSRRVCIQLVAGSYIMGSIMHLCTQVLHFHWPFARVILSITFSAMSLQFLPFHAPTLTSTSCYLLSLWDLT